jgi:hypothetical protein
MGGAAVQLFLVTTRHYYSILPRWVMRVIPAFHEAVCTQTLDRAGAQPIRRSRDMHGP